MGRQIYYLNPFKAPPKLIWDQGRKSYDLPPLRVQIYLGRFFKRSFLYEVYVFDTSKELLKLLGKTFIFSFGIFLCSENEYFF